MTGPRAFLSQFTLLAALILTSVGHGVAQPKVQPLDPELRHFPYPFPVQIYNLPTQNQTLRFAYMDVRPAHPNGKIVLLLHGKNFSGAYWAPTIRALTGVGYRVIAPDQIGFGKSAKPATFQFTFQALADNTHQLLQSLKITHYAVVGHSMGGMLATRMALMHPAEVQKLALVNPLGLEDWKRVVPYHTVAQNFKQELAATPQSIKKYQQDYYFAGQWKPQYDALIQIPVGWTRHPRFKEVAWDAALTSDMIFTQPVVYEFGLLQMPTLLIIGQRDKTAIGKQWAPGDVAAKLGNYAALGKATVSKIPHGQLVEIAGAGHLPQIEAFPQYKKALEEFLAK